MEAGAEKLSFFTGALLKGAAPFGRHQWCRPSAARAAGEKAMSEQTKKVAAGGFFVALVVFSMLFLSGKLNGFFPAEEQDRGAASAPASSK